MNEFLLEIYGEEIPSWGQRHAEKDLKDLINEFLVLNKIVYSKIVFFNSILYHKEIICRTKQ